MSRDGKKNSAFASGMRGREKPKVASSHGGTMVNDNGGENPTSTQRQEPGKTIGMPGGVDQTDPVYSSGMRGLERGSQKPAAKDGGTAGTATFGQARGSASGGENAQKANTMIGNPDGTDTSGRGARSGVSDAHLQSTAKSAHDLGIPGNNTEAASQGTDPIGAEEDETHINIKIPKKSITKKKAAGQAV